MKKKQFSEEQIIKILKEAEQSGREIRELSRQHGITEQTFYRWRQKYGGLSLSEAQRLRQLERENSRLKRIVADRDLEIDAMKELLEKKW
jgi:putative transposase